MFVYRGPSARPSQLLRQDPQVSRLQGQVNEVVGVMQNNISKVLDRGERLEDLHDKSGTFTVGNLKINIFYFCENNINVLSNS